MANINLNKEAYQTMKNMLGSLENRTREIYNKGYKAGVKEGIEMATRKMIEKVLVEVDADDCDHKCIQTEIGCERSSCTQEESDQC